MGPPSQNVLNWLHNVLTSEYRHVDRTYSDVAETLSYNQWLSLRTDVYSSNQSIAFEHGNSALLLNLYGSLPVSFRGTSYAFPVSIWIPREYPQVAPMNFVTPSKDMAIRPGQHISGEGRIYHPYLGGWRDDRSRLSELITILQGTFAREPPLVTRQSQISRPPVVIQHNGIPPPVPPLPPEMGDSRDKEEQPPSRIGQPPPPPPKPFASQRESAVQQGVGTPSLPQLPNRTISQHGPPPPIRPEIYSRDPHLQAKSPSQQPSSSWNNPEAAQWRVTSRDRLGQQQQRDPVSPLSPQIATGPQRPWIPESTQPQQGRHPETEPMYQPQPDYQNYHEPLQPPPPSQAPFPQSHSQAPYRQLLQQQPHLQNPRPAVDLLTSPFEAALPVEPAPVAPPPIPPNPQKDAILSALAQVLSEQVRSAHASNMSAISPLKAQQAALTMTLININKEMSQLNDLEKLLSSNEAILHQAMRDADKVLEDARTRQVPNVDEVLFAPTLVARQLYDAVADERAIEDCRTLLSKALDKGRIGGGVWAKQTRSLAREEFLKKALIKKISRGMGLIEEEKWN